MRPLRFSINITLDGCCDHRAMSGDEELHRHAADAFNQVDALLFGRVTYVMMEAAFRPTADNDTTASDPFAHAINQKRKYVVSSTLREVDWNAEIIRGDLATAVRKLKNEPGKGLMVGGIGLAQSLTELGLIDEYEFIVHPRLMGHGPSLFAGLSKPVDLKLIGRQELASGAVALRYAPNN